VLVFNTCASYLILKLYYDRRSVGQSVLVSGFDLGPATNFSPSLFNYFRQLRVCWCGAPSLTRSRVCSFQLFLGLASAVFLGSQSRRTHEHILSLFFRLTQLGWLPCSCIYIPRNKVTNQVSIIAHLSVYKDGLCGLVVRVLGYSSGGLGSIPGTTKKNSGSGTGSTQPHEYNWGATW
jgi:hypothetical protein